MQLEDQPWLTSGRANDVTTTQRAFREANARHAFQCISSSASTLPVTEGPPPSESERNQPEVSTREQPTCETDLVAPNLGMQQMPKELVEIPYDCTQFTHTEVAVDDASCPPVRGEHAHSSFAGSVRLRGLTNGQSTKLGKPRSKSAEQDA